MAGAVLLFALTGDGEQPAEQVESTTTTEPTTEATEAEPVTTTVPPETTTSIVVEPATVEPIAGAEIPNGFPIPPGALIERALSDGAFLRTYTIADTVAGIDSFYVDSGWTINARTESADLVEMTLSQDDQAVDVIISKLENTTGVTLVRLEVTPVR